MSPAYNYPRRTLLRNSMRFLGKGLLSTFTRSATPIRRYHVLKKPGEIVERRPAKQNKW